MPELIVNEHVKNETHQLAKCFVFRTMANNASYVLLKVQDCKQIAGKLVSPGPGCVAAPEPPWSQLFTLLSLAFTRITFGLMTLFPEMPQRTAGRKGSENQP